MTARTIGFRIAGGINLQSVLGLRGRVILRVHVGTLFDEEGISFSASPDALTGQEAKIRLPGGVFESWFFV